MRRRWGAVLVLGALVGLCGVVEIADSEVQDLLMKRRP